MRYLYLHGFASAPSSGKARYFAEQFSEREVRLEIPELDAGDFEHLTITKQLDLLQRLIGDDPVTLLGSSLGGYLAALFASSHSQVQKLILFAPAFRFGERWPEALGPERMAAWRETGTMPVFHYGEGGERNIHYEFLTDAARYDPFPAFRQPALLFHGTADEVVPAAYSEEFAALHANVQLRLLISDHQLTDQLELMWEEVEQFLFVQSRDESEQRANVVRLAFGGDEERFQKFCDIIREALPEAQCAVLRGSSVSGFRWKDNAPFDADGPGTSDLDLTLIGGEVLRFFALHGFYVPGIHTRPLCDGCLDVAPDLVPLRERLMDFVKRPVNIQASRSWIQHFRGDILEQPYVTLFGTVNEA